MNHLQKYHKLQNFGLKYKNVKTYYSKIEETYFDVEKDSIEKKYFKNIETYVFNDLMEKIQSDSNFVDMFVVEKSVDNKKSRLGILS